MKRLLTMLLNISAAIMPLHIMAQEVGIDSISNVSIDAYLSDYPKAICLPILTEGSHVYLSSDEANLLIAIEVANPQLQHRLLMMPTQVYIDPSGRKKKHYSVSLPSAMDVKEQMEAMRPAEREEGAMADRRPDIMPLIRALNQQGASFVAKKARLNLGKERFRMDMDIEKELLLYYILLPKETLMSDAKLSSDWTLCIRSDNNANMMPPPEEGMTEMEAGKPDALREDDTQFRDFMQKNIMMWIPFSIDEVNNIR